MGIYIKIMSFEKLIIEKSISLAGADIKRKINIYAFFIIIMQALPRSRFFGSFRPDIHTIVYFTAFF